MQTTDTVLGTPSTMGDDEQLTTTRLLRDAARTFDTRGRTAHAAGQQRGSARQGKPAAPGSVARRRAGGAQGILICHLVHSSRTRPAVRQSTTPRMSYNLNPIRRLTPSR